MKKIIKKIITVILSLIIITLIGTSTWNKAMCIKEDRNLSEIGTDVNVNGKNIRVSVEGDGNKTIILLSGMGTPEPIVDFKPLSKKLSENYKVVTIEYSGYGLSDDSSEKRNNEVIVEEIRQTLNKASFSENVELNNNCEALYDVKYPDNIPVLLFLSKDSCRIYKNQNLGTTWEELHEEVISNEKIQKIEYLDGKHYLHWTQSNNIAEMTKEFLENQK